MARGRRILIGGVIVAALVVAAGAGTWWFLDERQQRECSTNQANATAAPDQAGSTDGVRAVVLGDSWSSGWGLDDPTDSFAYQLVESQSWQATIDAFPGSGYVAKSPCGGEAFSARADQIPADAKVVVIEGGINDAAQGASSDELTSAAADVLAAVRTSAPAARVIVVGPPRLPGVAEDDIERVDGVLAEAAAAARAQYVSTLEFDIDISPDGIHPTADGHEQLAAELASALAAD